MTIGMRQVKQKSLDREMSKICFPFELVQNSVPQGMHKNLAVLLPSLNKKGEMVG